MHVHVVLPPEAEAIADNHQASTWHSQTGTPLYSTSEPMDRPYVFAPRAHYGRDHNFCSTISSLPEHKPAMSIPNNGGMQGRHLCGTPQVRQEVTPQE